MKMLLCSNLENLKWFLFNFLTKLNGFFPFNQDKLSQNDHKVKQTPMRERER